MIRVTRQVQEKPGKAGTTAARSSGTQGGSGPESPTGASGRPDCAAFTNTPALTGTDGGVSVWWTVLLFWVACSVVNFL